MHELTPESQALIFDFLESHSDPTVWDALLSWVRHVADSPLDAAGLELPGRVLLSFVPGSDTEIAYRIVEGRPPQIWILRIRER